MSITTPVTDTINLADYFFDGHDFNWKNVELTIEKWNTKLPGEEHLSLTVEQFDTLLGGVSLYANADPPDEPTVQFWIIYENIELVFEVGVPGSVQWCPISERPMNWANFEYGDSSTILPRDGTALLQHLGYDADPDAKDIPAFWERLVKFLEQHLERHHIPTDPDNIPAELIDELKRKAEEADQAWDTLKREGMIVPQTDEHGSPVYRDGRPVYIESPKGLNMDSGWKGLN
jgi:hypothetical protein